MSDTAAVPSTRAFSYHGYRFFWLATMLTSFAVQIVAVSVGWQVYDITGQPLLLGFVGLSLFLPSLLLVLLTGLVADRVNRRLIMAMCLAVECACAIFMVGFTVMKVVTIQEWEAIPFGVVALGVLAAVLHPRTRAYTG